MRRILFGVVAVVLMLTSVALPKYGNSLDDVTGYVKAWETLPEDHISIFPAIASDGRLYGINTSFFGGVENKLICIDEGKIAWSSQESFNFGSSSNFQTLQVDNLVLAGESINDDNRQEKKTFLLICYTADGKKVWDKKMEFSDYLPSYEVYKGNLWVIIEKMIYILDAKTGSELKKIDMSKTVQSQALIMNSVLGPNKEKKLKYAEIKFVGDALFLLDEKRYRSYKIKDDLSLEQKWERELAKTSDGYPIPSNYSTWFQSNEDFFLMVESDNTIVCRSSDTGSVKWEMELEEVVYSWIYYNKEYMLIGDFGPFSCYTIADQAFAWTYKSEGFPAALTDKYAYFIIDDREGQCVDMVRLKTGSTITKVTETDIEWIIVFENDLYLLKNNGISKYKMCSPCSCQIKAVWKENGKDSIDTEICTLDEKKLEIIIENPNDKAIVECSFATSSAIYATSVGNVTVGPGQSKSVYVNCTVGIEYPETLDGFVEIKTNCNQTFKLLIKARKASSCREKLKKNWSMQSGNFYSFGDVLVRLDTKSTGFFSSKMTGLTGLSMKTGKPVWSISASELTPDYDRMEIEETVDKLIIISYSGPSINGWLAVNSMDGKIAWKRDSGLPAKYGQWYKTRCSKQSQATLSDLFDIATGKTLVSKLKLECDSSVRMECKIGSNYLLYVYTSSTEQSDEQTDDRPNAWLVRPDGKVFWKKNLFACLAKDVHEYDTLYLMRNLEPEDEENDYFKCKIAKVDPIKLNAIWSIVVDGYPTIVVQDEKKVVFSYYGGISCYNPADGKKLWGYSDENHGMSYPVQVKGILYSQTWNRDEKSPEKNQMYAIDPQTGKNMHDMVFDWYAYYHWDGKYLYIVDENWDLKPKKNIMHCIDVDEWKTIWTATGFGELIKVGQKLIFDDGEKVAWFEDGKQAGSYDIGSSSVNDEGYLRKSSQYEWIGDRLYISKKGCLWVVDAKSSSLELKLANERYSDVSEIVYDYDSWYGKKSYTTPCVMDGKILYGQKNTLEQYDVAQ